MVIVLDILDSSIIKTIKLDVEELSELDALLILFTHQKYNYTRNYIIYLILLKHVLINLIKPESKVIENVLFVSGVKICFSYSNSNLVTQDADIVVLINFENKEDSWLMHILKVIPVKVSIIKCPETFIKSIFTL